MALLDKLKFWKKSPAAAPLGPPPPPPRVDAPAPLVEPLPDEPLQPMTTEELQAEIGRLIVIIPPCSTDPLRMKYQRKLEALIARTQG